MTMPRFNLPAGTMDIALDSLYPKPDPYTDDAPGWIRGRLGEHVWSKQAEICDSVMANRYTAVKACHGPGKSFIAARIGCWWNSVHELGSSFLVTTAPSWPQIEAILWREMRRAHKAGSLRGRMTLDCQWHMGEQGGKRGGSDEELIAMGRKPADYDEQAFQGIHARYVLIIVDEASGVPEQLFNAAHSLMTNEHCRMLIIGNPDDPTSYFAELCKPQSNYHVISIPVWDTPNMTAAECLKYGVIREQPDEYVPQDVSEMLVGPTWVADRAKDWGVGSPLWIAKVEAEFPEITDDTLFTPKMIREAQELTLAGSESGQFGADIARFGEDETVVYRNRGGQIRLEHSAYKQDTMQTAGAIAKPLNALKQLQIIIPAIIDAEGLGAGVYDRLREQGHEVGAFYAGQQAFDRMKFKNRRAEAYWKFRAQFEAGLIDIDPLDDKLAAQLLSLRWFLDSSGRIQLESKDDMKKRGMPSPDRADAAMLTTVRVGEIYHGNPMGGLITSDLLKRPM